MKMWLNYCDQNKSVEGEQQVDCNEKKVMISHLFSKPEPDFRAHEGSGWAVLKKNPAAPHQEDVAGALPILPPKGRTVTSVIAHWVQWEDPDTWRLLDIGF